MHYLRAAALFLTAAGCGTPTPHAWHAEVLLIADAGLGGCAVGDVADRWAGAEVVATAGSGSVYVAHRDGERWRHERIASLPGEMIQVAVGDGDPGRNGLEIFAVGMAEGPEAGEGAGAAVVLFHDGESWRHERIATDERLLHGVCVADADPSHTGAEVYLVGFTNLVHQATKTGGGWRTEVIGELSGPGKCAHPFDGGVAVGCADGGIFHCRKRASGWTCEPLLRADSGVARMGSHDGRLVFCCDDGTLRIRRLDASTEVVHREDQKLRGAVLADLDPSRDGLEAATAGYGKQLTLLGRRGNGGWETLHTFVDSDRFHHVAAGELDGDPASLEVVACGYSKKLTLIRRRASR